MPVRWYIGLSLLGGRNVMSGLPPRRVMAPPPAAMLRLPERALPALLAGLAAGTVLLSLDRRGDRGGGTTGRCVAAAVFRC